MGIGGIVFDDTAVHLHRTFIEQLDGTAGKVREVVFNNATFHDNLCMLTCGNGPASITGLLSLDDGRIAADHPSIDYQLTLSFIFIVIGVFPDRDGSSAAGPVAGYGSAIDGDSCKAGVRRLHTGIGNSCRDGTAIAAQVAVTGNTAAIHDKMRLETPVLRHEGGHIGTDCNDSCHTATGI